MREKTSLISFVVIAATALSSLGELSLFTLGVMNVKLYEILLLVSLCYFVVVALEGKRIKINKMYLSLIALFLLIVLSSFLNANYPIVSVKQSFLLSVFICLSILIIVFVDTKTSLMMLYKCVLFVGFILLFLELVRVMGLGNSTSKFANGTYFFYRPKSFFSEANEFGQYLVFLISFSAVPIIARVKMIKPFLQITISVLALFLIIPNMSRGSWFGCIIGLFSAIVCMQMVGLIRVKITMVLKFIIVIVGLVASIFVIIPNVFPVKYTSNINSVIISRVTSFYLLKDATVDDRYSFNMAGLNAFKTHPIIGIGFGNIFSEIPYGYDETTSNQLIPKIGNATTANFAVDILAETGLFGLGLFVTIILYSIIVNYYNAKYLRDAQLRILSIGCIASIIGLSVNGISYASHMLPFLWICFGLTYALQKSRHAERKTIISNELEPINE